MRCWGGLVRPLELLLCCRRRRDGSGAATATSVTQDCTTPSPTPTPAPLSSASVITQQGELSSVTGLCADEMVGLCLCPYSSVSAVMLLFG